MVRMSVPNAVCCLGCVLGMGVFLGIVPLETCDRSVPDDITIRIPGTIVPMKLVRCPSGELKTDSGETVSIDSLLVLTTEITWDLYDIYVFELDEPDGSSQADAVTRPSKPYIPPDRGFGHDGYPAIGMTRQAAEGFCAWLSLKTGLSVRLPTANEWTFLAVGDTQAPYCCGIGPEDLGEAAWYSKNGEHTTHPVAQKMPNQFGLFDIHGNAAEWVMSETRKPIAMGGSYRDDAQACTAISSQTQARSWNVSDPQIPKSSWWLADCSWVGFRFVISTESIDLSILEELSDE